MLKTRKVIFFDNLDLTNEKRKEAHMTKKSLFFFFPFRTDSSVKHYKCSIMMLPSAFLESKTTLPFKLNFPNKHHCGSQTK